MQNAMYQIQSFLRMGNTCYCANMKRDNYCLHFVKLGNNDEVSKDNSQTETFTKIYLHVLLISFQFIKYFYEIRSDTPPPSIILEKWREDFPILRFYVT